MKYSYDLFNKINIEGDFNELWAKTQIPGMFIAQNKEEFRTLCYKVAEIKPKIIVEIGTHMGGTTYLFRKLFPNAKIISIDMQQDFLGQIPQAYYNLLLKLLGVDVLIRGNSHDNSTFQSLVDTLGGLWIDFLFIDGDHTYKGVKQDHQMYGKFVRPEGLIAFHDVVKGPKHIECDKYWRELNTGIQISYEKDRMGIGIIKV